MFEWKKESNYVIHESGFTIIVDEGSFIDPSSIQIKQADGISAIEQVKLLREGMDFIRSKTHVDSIRMISQENNPPRITVKKTRKISMREPTE